MSDIIDEDVIFLSTISRFGISFGFGNKKISEACDANGVDKNTFLAVVNFLAEIDDIEVIDIQSLSVETVIQYLTNGHNYFLSYKLPSIRQKLIQVIESNVLNRTYQQAFIHFFDDYVAEVRRHMDYEDSVVFPYVTRLLAGVKDNKYSITRFYEQHTEIDSKLKELKDILIKHYPSSNSDYLLSDVVLEILFCEKELAIHTRLEDYFFVPVVFRIEQAFPVNDN